ncbi:YkgJ family cysteine cluster protein [Musicola keenii]|uniref:YkgJ family cysteine cluster protein n=1 Tax=Musicola keenii TaxID=2884250 RepID=UPI00177B20F3|nr:YkgJ family cysteine cluster protein [Musicola keenii]
MSRSVNPCMQCGACCGYFRVSFYWSEAADGGGCVPVELTQQVSPFLRCMEGTNCRQPHCIALEGEIRHAVRCRIYEQRQSPCRELSQPGEHRRAYYGLPPLTQETLPDAVT